MFLMIILLSTLILLHYRLPNSNYGQRPRFPLYQTTPFTIDPSARSGQTFCERYGVSPPAKSNDSFIYDDGPFAGDTNSGYFQNGDSSKQTTNHMGSLSNASTNHKQVDSNQQQATVIQFAERDKTSNNSHLIKTSSNNQQPPQYHVSEYSFKKYLLKIQ